MVAHNSQLWGHGEGAASHEEYNNWFSPPSVSSPISQAHWEIENNRISVMRATLLSMIKNGRKWIV